MRQLPILFSTPMVQAIKENRKTMTRRTAGLEKVNENPDNYYFQSLVLHASGRYTFAPLNVPTNFIDESCIVIAKPRYQVGDKLWVRETFTVLEPEHCYDGMKSRFVYKADCDDESEQTRKDCVLRGWPYQWKPSIFMPKEAARFWLEVTEVRCERLHALTEPDAIAEGIESRKVPDGIGYKNYTETKVNYWLSPNISFFTLWISINGLSSLNLNPFVFVYTFKLIKQN